MAAALTPASTVRAALGAFAALKHPLSASGVGVLNVIAAYLYCFEPNVVAASLWLGLVAVITGFYWTWVVGPPSAPPAALTAAELQPALERAVELYNRGAAASLAVVRATEPKAALAVAASLWAGAHAAAALGATFFVWAALDLVLCGPPLARALAARPALLNHAAAVGAMVRGLAAPQLAQVASLAEEKNAKLGLFGGACLAVLYYVFVVPLHHKLLIAGVRLRDGLDLVDGRHGRRMACRLGFGLWCLLRRRRLRSRLRFGLVCRCPCRRHCRRCFSFSCRSGRSSCLARLSMLQ